MVVADGNIGMGALVIERGGDPYSQRRLCPVALSF